MSLHGKVGFSQILVFKVIAKHIHRGIIVILLGGGLPDVGLYLT